MNSVTSQVCAGDGDDRRDQATAISSVTVTYGAHRNRGTAFYVNNGAKTHN
jgi:hypothetical protein